MKIGVFDRVTSDHKIEVGIPSKDRHYVSKKYSDYKKRKIRAIKKMLLEDITLIDTIKFGKNWVRIGNTTFNGFTAEEIDEIVKNVLEKIEREEEN